MAIPSYGGRSADRFDSQGTEFVDWGLVPHRMCQIDAEYGPVATSGDGFGVFGTMAEAALVGAGCAAVVGWLMVGRARRRKHQRIMDAPISWPAPSDGGPPSGVTG